MVLKTYWERVRLARIFHKISKKITEGMKTLMSSELMKTLGLCIAGLIISIAIWQFQVIRIDVVILKGKKNITREQRFQLRQGRRRLQMHGLLGLAGLCMLVGIYIPHLYYPLYWFLAWLLTIIFTLWTMMLALIDSLSIKLFFHSEQSKTDNDKK